MGTHKGLYFPYFHFPSDEWVKLAALYWDNMYRIVPSGYPTNRDTQVVDVLSRGTTPFIRNVHPEEHFVELDTIKWAFLKLIENNATELVKHYGVEHRHDWAPDPYTATYAPDANPKLAYIYSPKIEAELRQVLFDRGLGTTRSDSGPDYQWIGMHPRLANVYMSALAEALAPSSQSHPVSNDATNYFAVSGFTFERLAQVLLDNVKVGPRKLTEGEVEAEMAFIAFRAVMPKDINVVPIDSILAIREKYAGEFGRFQDFVQGIVAKLPKLKEVEGEEFVRDDLESEFQKQIQPKVDELDYALNSLGIETIPMVINVEAKVPTLLAGAGLIAGVSVINPILGATAAVAMGLLKIIADKRKAIKEEIKKSDVAFLLRVREEAAPAMSLERLNLQARKYLFGE